MLKLDNDGNGVSDADYTPSAVLNSEDRLDMIKPETIVLVDGFSDQGGVFAPAVIVTLEANDNESGSGILKTEYSFDKEHWTLYSSSLNLSADGEHKIYFKSTDRAGNIETIQEIIVMINKEVIWGIIDSAIHNF